MKTYHILGHSNAVMSIILDALYLQYANNIAVVRVGNLSIENMDSSQQPFHIDNIKVSEIFHENWKYEEAENLLLGVFRVNPKKQIYQFFANHYQITTRKYTTLVHSHSSVAHTAQISPGVQIGPGVAIAPYAELGNFVTVNRNASIGHHTKIGDFVTLNPGCNVAGNCLIGNSVTIGMGANIMDGIEIGDNVVIGAGALVTKSVEKNTTVYGVPARKVKIHEKLL